MTNLIDKYISSYSVEYHKNQGLKDYCISRIEPKLQINFKRGDIVSIKVRTTLDEIEKQFEQELSNDLLKVIFIDKKTIRNKKLITQIYTLTPAIFQGREEFFKDKKFNNYVLSNREDLEPLKLAILKNASAKAKLDKTHDFIKSIKVRNKYPIKIKNIRKENKYTYLADSLEIEVKDDEISQKIANSLIALALGKGATSGNGFINYKLLK